MRRYAEFARHGTRGIAAYVEDVRERRFPAADQAWRMKAGEAAEFDSWLSAHPPEDRGAWPR